MRSDGTVIKFMCDNTIEIYYANGTIYRKQFELVNENLVNEAQVDHVEVEQTHKPKQGRQIILFRWQL